MESQSLSTGLDSELSTAIKALSESEIALDELRSVTGTLSNQLTHATAERASALQAAQQAAAARDALLASLTEAQALNRTLEDANDEYRRGAWRELCLHQCFDVPWNWLYHFCGCIAYHVLHVVPVGTGARQLG